MSTSVYYLLFTIQYLLFVIYYLVFTIYYLLTNIGGYIAKNGPDVEV